MPVVPKAANASLSDLFQAQPPTALLRLQSRSQFQAVLNGQTLARSAHFSLHGLTLEDCDDQARRLFAPAGVWIGAMVPKRWARRAVTRNTIKRQIYAVSRDAFFKPTPAAYLVRLRAGFDPARFISACSPQLKKAVRMELAGLLAASGVCA